MSGNKVEQEPQKLYLVMHDGKAKGLYTTHRAAERVAFAWIPTGYVKVMEVKE